MRCPRCDAKLENNAERCQHCGQDLAMIKHVYRLSNTYYNIGLDKAHVRDLTGACESLKKSLSFNKKNTDARNLLGLVYCEMGETVAALSEWVLSKYLQPEDNAADAYIDTVQANPVGLDNVNQTIKKYNAALTAAKSGNEDLAIIQLKKVVALNPNFVRAQQLLALLYMEGSDYQKAYKCLKRAKKIDSSNTITLRYMREVCSHMQRPAQQTTQSPVRGHKDPLANVTPVGSYQEDKKSWMPYLNILIGLVVGILVTIFLIRPTLQNRSTSSSSLVDVKDELSVKTTELASAKKKNTTLQKKVDDLQKQLDGGMSGEEKYQKLLAGVALYMDGKTTEAAASVAAYKETDFADIDEAKVLFNKIAKKLSTGDANKLFISGRDKYNTGKYEAAIVDLEQAISIEPENLDALYFLGRVYHQQKDYDKAKDYYNQVITIDKTSSRAAEAKSRLAQLKSITGSTKSKATSTPQPSASSEPNA